LAVILCYAGSEEIIMEKIFSSKYIHYFVGVLSSFFTGLFFSQIIILISPIIGLLIGYFRNKWIGKSEKPPHLGKSLLITAFLAIITVIILNILLTFVVILLFIIARYDL